MRFRLYLQASDGLPAEHQVLRCNGRLLADDAAACGDCAADGATLHLTSRLRGGKPVKVGGALQGLGLWDGAALTVGAGSAAQGRQTASSSRRPGLRSGKLLPA